MHKPPPGPTQPPPGPTRVYYARAMDRAAEASIRGDEAVVRELLAKAGFVITNPFRAKLSEPVDALALVEDNRRILAESALMIANLTVPLYPYVGLWFEMAEASARGIPVASWVGSSGYEHHHYLNVYCEFIGVDIHSVVEYLQRAHTCAGVTSQMDEAKAYYEAIATRYDEMTSHCYPEGRDSCYDMERADMAGTLIQWCRGKSVLELGCGNGTWTASIAESARSVRCVDASQTMLDEARARTESSLVFPEFMECDFFDPQLRFDSIEVIVGYFLLGFIPRLAQQQLLRRIVDECDPGTIVILGESVRQSDTPGFGLGPVRLQSRDVDGRSFVICKEVFSPSALTARVRAAGLDILETRQPASWFSSCVAQVPR